MMMTDLISALTIPANGCRVALVRAWVRLCLGGCSRVEDVVLCFDELVCNSIVHADGGRVTAELWDFGRGIRGEVRDAGGTTVPRVTTPEGTGGRGLVIVSALTSEWGTKSDEGGQLTYFVVSKQTAAIQAEVRILGKEVDANQR